MERLQYICTTEDDGLEVLTLLRREFRVSTNLLRQLKVTENGIMLDDTRVTVRHTVQPGQVLSILREPDSGKERRVEALEGPLDIVYEDSDLMILNKPAGLAVHPSPGHYDGDTLGNRVVYHLTKTGQNPTFRAINRLDRGTSGLMTCAKNKLSAHRLEELLAQDGIRRTYHAVCEGVGLPVSGTIDLPIGRAEGFGIKRAVREDGQRAVTHYETVGSCEAEGERISLLSITLETGRTHQIRVHCTHMGCPLLGDCLYYTDSSRAVSDKLEVNAQLLHAVDLFFTHPITGENLAFHAPVLRDDMKRVLQLFE